MRDHKVGSAELPVERRRGKHYSGKTRNQKLKQESHAEKHGRFENELPSPHRANPIEDLDAGGNADRHRGEGEKTVCIGVHSDGEHVVRPDTKAHESNGYGRRHHYRISKDGLAREHRDNLGHKCEGRNDQNVDFRMCENPEEMHPQYGGATRLCVEKMGAQKAVERKHDLRRGKRRNGEEHHCGHHEIQPCKQGHLAEGHPRAAQTNDGRQDIYGSSNAANSRDQETERPEVSAMSWREYGGRERSISEPSNVGSISSSIQSVATNETEVEQQSSESCEPETEGIEARKRHVASANHQRNQIVSEPK